LTCRQLTVNVINISLLTLSVATLTFARFAVHWRCFWLRHCHVFDWTLYLVCI